MRALPVLLTALLLATATASASPEDSAAQLQKLRDAGDGVIVTVDEQLKQWVTGDTRPYALVIFLSAKQVMDNPQLQLGALREEFVLAAKALKAGPAPDSAYFLQMVFEDSPRIFNTLKLQQVPYIFRLPADKPITLRGLTIAPSDKMTFDTVQGKYPWKAETMVEYWSRSGLQFGRVHRPTLFNHPLFPVLAVSAAVGLLGLAYLLLRVGALHHPLIWAMGSLAVFWFSVSGGMFNIIRGMPMFMRDRKGKLQFFLNNRSAQLGAEGFIVGTGYLIFSATIALTTFAVPRVRSKVVRSVLSWLMLLGSTYMALRLFQTFSLKTGYKVNTYLI